MTEQKRRIEDKLPAQPLDWSDTGSTLAAAGLAHLEAEKAGACLVHAKDDVWVGVGSKDALRGLLSDDTASQSQAVPSELASRLRQWAGDVRTRTNDLLHAAADEIDRLSHSAATGKVPEGWTIEEVEGEVRVKKAGQSGIVPRRNGETAAEQILFDLASDIIAASPAAPLAGKAEPSKQTDDWRYGRVTAPLASAVPAEEAKPCLMGEYACSNPAQCWEPCGQLGKSAEHATPADAEQATDELSDEEKAALDRLDKPEWRAASHLKLRAVLAVEVQRTISMGAKIENLQDELRAARLSKPTAQGTAQSIESIADELEADAMNYEGDFADTVKGCAEALRHIAAQAPAGRDAMTFAIEQLEKLEGGATNVAENARLRGDDYDVGYAEAMAKCAREAADKLKSHAAEQTEGSK